MAYATRQVTVGVAAAEIIPQRASRTAWLIRVVSGGDLRIGPPTVTVGGTAATAGLLVKLTDTYPTMVQNAPGGEDAAGDSLWAIRDAAVDSVISIMEVMG